MKERTISFESKVKQMLKMEINRIIGRPIFWLVILVGIVIAVWPIIQTWPHGVTDAVYVTYTGSAYIMWMYILQSGLYHIYALTFPLLTTLAYSDAYAEDFNTGFIKNILTKVEKKKYLKVRYGVNFVLGGLVVVFPLVINFMGEMLAYPLIENSLYFGMRMVTVNGFMPELFYSHPFIYTVLRMLSIFLFGGMLSSLALALSTVIKNRYIVLVFPFIILIGLDVLLDSFGLYSISNLFLYNNGAAQWNLLVLLIGIPGGFIWYYWAGMKNETI